MGSAAAAQTAAEIFGCTLPYRTAMEAMAKLTVTRQTSDPGLLVVIGPSTTIEFAPGSALIHGYAPSSLSLKMQEPAPDDYERIYEVTFEARLPRDEALDRAIISAHAWHLNACGVGIALCQRANDPDSGPELTYWRDYNWSDGQDEPHRLTCSYKIPRKTSKNNAACRAPLNCRSPADSE